MQKIIAFTTCFFLFIVQGPAQNKIHVQPLSSSCFQNNETITYEMGYSLFILNTGVGEVKFMVKDTIINGKSLYHLIGAGKSYPFYDYFFKVRDTYESWVNKENLRPLEHNRDVSEGGYKIDVHYKFNWEDSLVYSQTKKRNKEPRLDTIPLNTNTQDIVSAVYLLRNNDYSKYLPGDSILTRFLFDNTIEELKYCYKGKEEKKIKGLGTFRCLKFSCPLLAGSMFDKDDEIRFWITDDKNQVPILIESPIIVGTVKATLKNYKNLKHPTTSKIDKQ